MKGKRPFKGCQSTPYESIKMVKSQEDLDHHELATAAQHAESISVKANGVGKYIFKLRKYFVIDTK